MHDRSRAISILKQARDLLAERLTDRVCEMHGELLAEAMGLENHGDIDTLYDQVGLKLAHVTAMLANLPTVDPPTDDPLEEPAPPVKALAMRAAMPVAVAGDRGRSALTTLAAEAAAAGTGTASRTGAANFPLFLAQVNAGQLEAAGRTLGELLGLEHPRATRCAARFRTELLASPHFVLKAVQLRTALARGAADDAMLLLWECFGLEGAESRLVMQTLQNRLRTSS